ncbi:hypothetical protein ACOMHN_002162 [Nucella lapillus]
MSQGDRMGGGGVEGGGGGENGELLSLKEQGECPEGEKPLPSPRHSSASSAMTAFPRVKVQDRDIRCD